LIVIFRFLVIVSDLPAWIQFRVRLLAPFGRSVIFTEPEAALLPVHLDPLEPPAVQALELVAAHVIVTVSPGLAVVTLDVKDNVIAGTMTIVMVFTGA
jgi:hypothetical protein